MWFIGSRRVELLDVLLPMLIDVGRLGIVLSFAISVIKPGLIPIYRLSALAIAYVLITSDPGGYSVLFFFFLVFFERWKNPFLIAAIVLTYVMSVSADIMILKVAHQLLQSYITKREVGYDLGLNVGELTRPGLVLVVVYSLVGSCVWEFLTQYFHGRSGNRNGTFVMSERAVS